MINYLKAVLTTVDTLDDKDIHVYASQCHTVQRFAYTFEHHCNSWGIPFDSTKNTVITTQIKVIGVEESRCFTDYLSGVDCHSFTFFFNATFDNKNNNKLYSYEDAMRVKGMVVDVNYDFDSVAEGNDQQMLVTVKILVSAVTYLGSSSNKTLQISEV